MIEQRVCFGGFDVLNAWVFEVHRQRILWVDES